MRLCLAAVLAPALVAAATPSPFGATDLHQSPLGFSGDTSYKTFTAPELDGYSVRIREQSDSVCDARSKQYTGWLDIPGKHLFFWYVESLNDPQNDPLNLWMTGGPGCSGMIGMMLELGPCLINANGTGTYHNPYSWTQNASMIFIDQPAGTGFSYVENGTDVPGDSFVGAVDMYMFLRIFLTQVFPEKRGVPFHISGESYGGHYVPTLAAEIIKRNELAPQHARIPLTSIMIGDGFVSPLDITVGYYETLCTTKPGVETPVFNETRCQHIAESLPRCIYLHEACYAFPDEHICKAADNFCISEIRQFFDNEAGGGGRDPFDITRTCEVDLFCYNGVLEIEKYMNSPVMKKALHVTDDIPRFELMSNAVNDNFLAGNDYYVNTAKQVRFVIENGVDVLIYNGNLDLACNTAGNLRWSQALPWNGQAEFNAQDMKPWSATVNGTRVQAGTFKEAYAFTKKSGERKQRFSFVTFDRAGHMVPYNQPETALQMVNIWLAGGKFE